MSELVEEVKIWHTPLIGAYLLWRFTQGYCKAHPSGDAPVGLLHFIASAILTHSQLSKPITNRRKNLQSYVLSFDHEKKVDFLVGIHERVKDKKSFTLSAIDAGISQGLFVWDSTSGKIYPAEPITKLKSKNKLRPSVVKEGVKAEILGKWFAIHEPHSIATYLKVVL